MPVDSLLERLLADEEPVRGIRCAELEQVLQGCGYTRVGVEGPYRTWKHDGYSRLLTVRDEGAQPMYSRYIDKTGRHLRAVRNAGGFNA